MNTPELSARFQTAATGKPATPEQRKVVATSADLIFDAANHIDAHVPDGRHKALALTALEEALMWANKGVFS